jgi:hypothetical protein
MPVWNLWSRWLLLGLLDIYGLFCVYLYPHSHLNPEIFPPLREMGFHL